MNDTHTWDKKRNNITSRKGGWRMGKSIRNHGYSMMDDLVGKKSFFQVLVLNVCSRLPEPRLAQWLEACFICLSWPDSRIWCNQIGALAGTMRTTPTAAVTAGTLAADSRMYGQGTLKRGAEFIQETLHRIEARESLEELLDNMLSIQSSIIGFARPIAKGDERVIAMRHVTTELGFAIGKHAKLANAIEQILLARIGESMNIVAFATSFLLDNKFSPIEIERIFALWVNSGIHACYVEAFDNTPGTFLPLRCDDIEYQGKPARDLTT